MFQTKQEPKNTSHLFTFGVFFYFLNGKEEKCFVFFFQAEDGIRDYKVTGVQTCALPIYPSSLDERIQWRMSDIAIRFMRSIGFDNGLFNIEMMYDEDKDAIHIIEANPRM